MERAQKIIHHCDHIEYCDYVRTYVIINYCCYSCCYYFEAVSTAITTLIFFDFLAPAYISEHALLQ